MSLHIRRRRTRTPKVRTGLSCPCPAGHTDNGQRFFENSEQNPDRQNADRKTSGSLFFYKNQDIFCCIKNNLKTIESNLRVRGLQIFDVHVRVRDSEKFPFLFMSIEVHTDTIPAISR